MQDKSIAECSIKLPFVIKIFVLSIFEWLLKTYFTVYALSTKLSCVGPYVFPLEGIIRLSYVIVVTGMELVRHAF